MSDEKKTLDINRFVEEFNNFNPVEYCSKKLDEEAQEIIDRLCIRKENTHER